MIFPFAPISSFSFTFSYFAPSSISSLNLVAAFLASTLMLRSLFCSATLFNNAKSCWRFYPSIFSSYVVRNSFVLSSIVSSAARNSLR